MITLIYALRDNHWIRYVGKTVNALEWRLASHLKAARDGENTHKGRGIRKMLQKGSIPTITLITVAEGNGNKEEKTWIAYFRSYGIDLWNETEGGDGASLGHIVSYKTRKHISKANKGRKHSAISRANMGASRLGHLVSLATRMKISKARTGQPSPLRGVMKSEAVRARMSAGKMGHSVSQKQIDKWRATRTARNNFGHSLAAKLKISQGLKGHSCSVKTREKIGKANRGRQFSKETRLHMGRPKKKS